MRSDNGKGPENTTSSIYVMRGTIWYHLHNFKNMKSTYGGVLLLVKLQAKAIYNPVITFTCFTAS